MSDADVPPYPELMAQQRRIAIRISLVAGGVAVVAVIALLVGGPTSLDALELAMCLPFIAGLSAFTRQFSFERYVRDT
jgi:hypothetical protein